MTGRSRMKRNQNSLIVALKSPLIFSFVLVFIFFVLLRIYTLTVGVPVDASEAFTVISIADAQNTPQNITLDVRRKTTFIGEDVKQVRITTRNSSIKEILFEDVRGDSLKLGVQELNPQEQKPLFVQAYALDPESVNFTKAKVKAVAKGRSLFKCVEWNFEEERCEGKWKKVRGVELEPGEEYEFELTPEDPGFGESIAPVDVLDKEDYLVDADQRIVAHKKNKDLIDVIIQPKNNFNGYIQLVKYFKKSSGASRELFIEPVPVSKDDLRDGWTNMFSINGVALNATNLRILSRTPAKSIFMCESWEFQSQRCNGRWKKIATVEKEIYNVSLQPTVAGFATSVKPVDILDRQNYLLPNDIVTLRKHQGASDVLVTLKDPTSKITNITIHALNETSTFHELNIDLNIANSRILKTPGVSQVYAINPEHLSFDNLTVKISPNHAGKQLYKCASWNFSTQECVVTRTCSKETDERGNPYCTVTGGWVKVADLEEREGYALTLNATDPAYAEYSNAFTAPYCANGESPCSANSSLLQSRDSLTTPEPNQPNTIDTCTDGTSGTYLTDESVENITITSLNNSHFRPGDTIQVEAWVNCYSNPADDFIGLVYTSNANTPSWSVKQTLSCPAGGLTKITFNNLTLDSVEGNHSVRVWVQYNPGGVQSETCSDSSGGSGTYDDNDDVVFLVKNAPDPAPAQVIFGETGEVTLGNFASTLVKFNQTYSTTPLIFATPVTQNAGPTDDDSALIPLIYSINTTHMNITICQDNGATTCDPTVVNETLHYFVFDPSKPYPEWMEVGTVIASTNGADTPITFSKTFNNTPYVFTQAQTYNQGGSNIAPVAWVDDITTTGANIIGCTHQGTGNNCDTSNPSETFAYLAIDVLNANFSKAVNFQYGSEDISNSAWTPITWTANYTNVRMMVTQNDDDGNQDPQYAWARDVNTTTPDIRYCEQDGADDCDTHTSEFVMWFTMEQGLISIGEPVTQPIEVVDESGSSVAVNATITNQSGELQNITAIPLNETSVQEIVIINHNVSTGQSMLRLTNITNDSESLENTWALDPTGLDFEYINVTFTAQGNNLFKCTDFNFTSQTCLDDDNYTLILTNMTPGQNYTITLLPGDPGFGETITGPANISDARFRSGSQSSTNYGSTSQLRAGYRNNNNIHRSIISFDLSHIPPNVTITNAELGLYFYSIPTGDDTATKFNYSLHRVQQNPARNWTELNVTWDTYDGVNSWTNAGGDFIATPTDTVALNGSDLNTFAKWNVTADVIAFYNNLSTNFGWILKEDTDLDGPRSRKNFRSKDWSTASEQPYLIINYTDLQVPSVTNVQPQNTTHATKDIVPINATVTDNVGVDTVIAQVKVPKFNTYYNITMTDPDGDNVYEANFSQTWWQGDYEITIFANDTGNLRNDTQKGMFKIPVRSGFPTGDVNDGRMIAVIGTGYSTRVTTNASIFIVVPGSDPVVNISILDGDFGGVFDAGTGGTTTYTLYADKDINGTKLFPLISHSSADFTDNTLETFYAASQSPNALNSDGDYYYRLDFSFDNQAASAVNLFKLITQGKTTIFSPLTGFQFIATDEDAIFGSVNTTYLEQGDYFEFFINVPPGESNLTFLDDDADYSADASSPGAPSTPFIYYELYYPNGTLIGNNTDPSGNTLDEENFTFNIDGSGGLYRWIWYNVNNQTTSFGPNNIYTKVPFLLLTTNAFYNGDLNVFKTDVDVNGGLFFANDTVFYNISINNPVAETAPNVTLYDPIPAYAKYVPESIVYQGVHLTDAADGDAGDFNVTVPNAVFINISNITGFDTVYASFNVTLLQGPENLTEVKNQATVNFSTNGSQVSDDPDTILLADETGSEVDFKPPSVFDLKPNQTFFNQTTTVNISAKVIDVHNISTVIATVTYPNLTTVNLTMAENNQGNYSVFFNVSIVGIYTYRIFANDTYKNINYTQTNFFIVNDSIGPNITAIVDAPDPVDGGSPITIRANVSDENSIVTSVICEIDYNNGTLNNFSMTFVSGTLDNGTWELNFSDQVLPGVHNYTIYASDGFGNNATPVTGNFTVNPTVSISLLQYPIDFGNTTAGDVNRPADNGTGGNGYEGGLVKGFPLIVVNEGNVNANVSIKGTDLVGVTNASYVINVTRVSFANTSNVSLSQPLNYTFTPALTNISALFGQKDLFFWISPVGPLSRQSYQGTVTLVAVQT
ncbi:DNRLRE domain-containing protein [Candidatus Woesearchaeota archaeon]|nr:MAG: DNRLRE domain-containing protein [Candidatus Woesearchaeota archaeon]